MEEFRKEVNRNLRVLETGKKEIVKYGQINGMMKFILGHKEMNNEAVLMFSFVLGVYHSISNYSQSMLAKASEFEVIYKGYMDKTQGIKKEFLDKGIEIFFNDVENLWEVILKMKEHKQFKEEELDRLLDLQNALLGFLDTFQFFLLLTSKSNRRRVGFVFRGGQLAPFFGIVHRSTGAIFYETDTQKCD